MREGVFILLFIFTCQVADAQEANNDSLKQSLASAKEDSVKYEILENLIYNYVWNYPDSSIPYLRQAILLANKIKSDHKLSRAYNLYSWYFFVVGDYSQALFFWQEALRLAEKTGDPIDIAQSYDGLANIYRELGDHRRAILLGKKGLSALESNWKPPFNKDGNTEVVLTYSILHNGLGNSYKNLNHYDSALAYAQILDEQSRTVFHEGWSAASFLFGNIYLNLKDYQKAVQFYRLGIDQSIKAKNKKDLMDNCTGLANAFRMIGDDDSSIIYATKAIEISKTAYNSVAKLKALQLLSEIYQSKEISDSTVKYLQLTIAAKDSLFSHRKIIQIQNMIFFEEQRRQKILDEQVQYKNKILNYALAGGLISVLAIASLLFRNNRQKQRARVKVEKAYSDLKNTQAQLIQSEKMASLGELTAGIAHEIQNPLNFMNNFSEVNKDLLQELKEEIYKGNIDDAKRIADDLISNEEKINHHGKRADSIVKGMLQHSRKSTGEKELTDINALADEYLRLAFHGMRARDKSFNASLKTEFDPLAGKIKIDSQDIARVLLNLYNNAFQSVAEKAKNNAAFNPEVIVMTRRTNGQLNIKVKDNGIGISDRVIDKIFQPFFTTKPTGQGTGLGLSLAYDAVRSHGGEIKVRNTGEGGAEFTIILPVTI